ncbi:hypothetical protein K8I61_01305 [bacterium]|nr:hypothetical protein [bacterium]
MPGKATLKKVRVRLPFMDAEWVADDTEEIALRNLVDQIRTRRAFHLNRGYAEEEPEFFLKSILEARTETRDLMKRLPLKAVNSRLIFMEVMNRLADVLDAWREGNERSRFDLERYGPPMRMVRIMESSWIKVEKIRIELDEIVRSIEANIGISK